MEEKNKVKMAILIQDQITFYIKRVETLMDTTYQLREQVGLKILSSAFMHQINISAKIIMLMLKKKT